MVSYFFACGQVTGMVAVLILVVVDNGLVQSVDELVNIVLRKES